jgi:hypothetical protein
MSNARPWPRPTVATRDATCTLRQPADLARWALVQARKEGTDRTQKITGFIRRWRAEVEAAEVAPQAQRQAESDAAVAAALKAKRRSAPKVTPTQPATSTPG